MKARNGVAVAALRSMLAAIDDAEAVDVGVAESRPSVGGEHVAGSTAGLGTGEVARRALSETEMNALVQAQVDELSAAAREYETVGRDDMADRLRAEADVIRRYLHPSR